VTAEFYIERSHYRRVRLYWYNGEYNINQFHLDAHAPAARHSRCRADFTVAIFLIKQVIAEGKAIIFYG